jgi:hypothetical protein
VASKADSNDSANEKLTKPIRKSSGSAKREPEWRFVGACATIVLGLAIAGSVDRATGGVILLIGWVAGVATLHKLGRSGSA